MVPAWASYTAVAMGGLPAPYAAYYKYLLNFSYPGGFHRYCLFLARSLALPSQEGASLPFPCSTSDLATQTAYA
jgi:hypothetical protein